MLTENPDHPSQGVHPGLGWISALRAPAIRKLVDRQELQLSLFDERNLAEISSEAFPGERLVACFNPLLAGERARKREDLLSAAEVKLEKIAREVRAPPQDAAQRGRDRQEGRPGARPLQGGQALPAGDRGRRFRLRAR